MYRWRTIPITGNTSALKVSSLLKWSTFKRSELIEQVSLIQNHLTAPTRPVPSTIQSPLIKLLMSSANRLPNCLLRKNYPPSWRLDTSRRKAISRGKKSKFIFSAILSITSKKKKIIICCLMKFPSIFSVLRSLSFFLLCLKLYYYDSRVYFHFHSQIFSMGF